MSDASPTIAPPAAPQYSVDWNNVALQAITTGLNQIPVVGGILAGLVFAFWPPSGQDIWDEIKQNVETLITNAVNSDDYTKAQDALGSRAEDSGLLGVLNTYLHTLTPGTHAPDDTPAATWPGANQQFIGAQPRFQQEDIKVPLLPLFAQFANMHLMLLRDGVLQKLIDVSTLQDRIGIYTRWVDQCYNDGLQARRSANQDFNYLNQYIQFMQVNVMRFREMWPYFDPTKYPAPVKVAFYNETYFTITAQLNMPGGAYQLPASVPDAPLTDVNVYWLQDSCDAYNLVLGAQSGYGATQEPYYGVLVNNAVPPVNQPCNDGDSFCYFTQNVGVSADNPIVAVQGVFDNSAGTYCVDFVFRDGSSTGQIPGQNQNSGYVTSFNIAPPRGYYLSSVWAPATEGYYLSAADVVFGFRYTPPPLDEAAAHALYVSSLQPVSLDDPLFAPFAAAAASQGWEGQRQQFLSSFQGAGAS